MKSRVYLYLLSAFVLMLSGCQTSTMTSFTNKGPAAPGELGNRNLCNLATRAGNWETRPAWFKYVTEARNRGLDCGVNSNSATANSDLAAVAYPVGTGVSDTEICKKATFKSVDEIIWHQTAHQNWVKAARRRGLDCNVNDVSMTTQIESSDSASTPSVTSPVENIKKNTIDFTAAKCELMPSILSCSFFKKADAELCEIINASTRGIASSNLPNALKEAKRRGLDCDMSEASSTQAASNTVSSSGSISSAELTAAQRKAERLEAELAALKAEQQTISNDTRVPIINQLAANSSGKQGIVTGRVRDNTGIAEVTVDGVVVQVSSDGRFEHRTFIPANGKQVVIEATDFAGLTSQKQLSLSREAAIQSASISFDSLNPLGKRVAKNRDALALVIGVSRYENTPAPAIYADSDALMFRDYASEKLGIPENRIKTLVNDTADERELLLSVKNWLTRSVKQNETDVYVFFAGHGLASDDGEKKYLLPYDGSPQLLDRTAILRDELFSDIAAANPRSVTVFLDTCYSGTTRGTDMLIASRPIVIRAKQQNIPDGFTVFTAAGGDQTAKPLEEAKHGMFSYFLMKGMEGDADSNSDNQITAAELHEYVEQNVVQQSGGSQVPELQGDAGRILVRFQ